MFRKLPVPTWLVNAVLRRAKKTPFSHLSSKEDGVYMERYWMLDPKGFFSRWFTARIHVIKRSDLDRHLHDHPWTYTTFILKGGYTEVTQWATFEEACEWWLDQPYGRNQLSFNDEMGKWEVQAYYGPGSVLRRPAKFAHRLIVDEGQSATTLFVMGNYQNKWGFHTPEGKVYWKDYLEEDTVAKNSAAVAAAYGDKRKQVKDAL